MTRRFVHAAQSLASRSGIALVPFAILFGCSSQASLDTGFDADSIDSSTVTWNDDVAPLIQANCASCHSAGSLDFSTYEDTAPWAEVIAMATEAGTMPPSNVDASGDCQEYLDPRWLDDDEIALLREWADAGAPLGEGDPMVTTAPAPASLDDIDVSMEAAIDYPLPGGGEQWRCYVLESDGITQPWLQGYQIVPQDSAVVHHATIRSLSDTATANEVRAMDAADPDPGYDCSTGLPSSEIVALYNPGTPATTFPEGTGVEFDASQPLLLEVHYNSTGSAGLTVNLDLADTVDREALVLGFNDTDFVLQPGEDYVEVTVDLRLPGTSEDRVTLFGVNPHMHDYGVSQYFELDPEGEATCLSSTPDFEQDWQQIYWYAEPLVLEGGRPVRLTCGFDTTTADAPIRFGPSYADEMCTSLMYAVVD